MAATIHPIASAQLRARTDSRGRRAPLITDPRQIAKAEMHGLIGYAPAETSTERAEPGGWRLCGAWALQLLVWFGAWAAIMGLIDLVAKSRGF